jgi:hypothetical protein
LKPQVDDIHQLKKDHPELVEKAYTDPEKYRYFVPAWERRTANFDVGQTTRPF